MPDLLRLIDGPLKVNAIEYPLSVWPPPERLLLLHFGDGSTVVGMGDADDPGQVSSLDVLKGIMECDMAIYRRGYFSKLPDGDHPFLARGAEYSQEVGG